MAVTQIDIANAALTKVGTTPIMSLSDNNKAARLCSLRLDFCKQYVLRAHPWNFAIRRITLSPLTDVPAYGFSAYFQLPSDCLRVLGLDADPDYLIEGRRIACNEATLNLKYISNDVPYTDWDPMAADALACYLAYDIAYNLTQSADLKASMLKDYATSLAKARFVDATEEPAPSLESSDVLDSRIGGVSGWVRDPGT